MKRRQALSSLMAALAAGMAAPSRAQAPRHRRVGLFGAYGPANAVAAPLWSALLTELAARGWSEGSNLQIVGRFNDGQQARDGALAAELLAADPDVVVASNSGTLNAARKATSSVPIVMVNVSHAVEAGFVASLARPGGNVTGVVNQAGDMHGKFVELLRSVRPELSRLGICWSPGNQGSALSFRDTAAAAAALGIRAVSLAIDRPDEADAALALARREGVQALQVHPTPAIATVRRQILSWALEQRVATLGQAAWVREGYLMSYWANSAELFRMAAVFVDRILRGAKPADLPVEQPTRFELALNLKTARAIGVKLPQALLLQADEVIE